MMRTMDRMSFLLTVTLSWEINRNDSKDSRFWSTTNYVKRSQILGKAWFRYSPSFSKYKSVDYSAE